MSDIYIKALEFGKDNPGFTLKQLEQRFPKEWGLLSREIMHSKLFQSDGKGESRIYYLSFEDRFRLLELEELREARKSAIRAHWFASISLLIAAASLVSQMYIQISAAI